MFPYKFSEIKMKPGINVEVLQEDTNVQVTENCPVKLQWKIKGMIVDR
jgi:hypothetical protein